MAKIELEQERYEYLLFSQMRLLMLENAIRNCNPYSASEIEMIQKVFELEER